MNAYYNKLMMYYEIHRLSRDYTISQISRELVLNRKHSVKSVLFS